MHARGDFLCIKFVLCGGLFSVEPNNHCFVRGHTDFIWVYLKVALTVVSTKEVPPRYIKGVH